MLEGSASAFTILERIWGRLSSNGPRLFALLAVLLPTPVGLLTGVPLRTLPSVMALLVVALAPGLALDRRGRAGGALLAMLVAITALKLLAGAVFDDSRFRACFSSPDRPEGPRPCEFSFESAFARGETRRDEAIRFGTAEPVSSVSATNWNLSFANTLAFNRFGPDVIEDPRRPRFSARWTGDVGSRRPNVTVTYIGRGSIETAGGRLVLPRSDAVRNVDVPIVVSGLVTVEFEFERLIPASDGPVPYAFIDVRSSGRPLTVKGDDGAAQLVGLVLSVLALSVFVLMLGRCVPEFRAHPRDFLVLAQLAAVGGGLHALQQRHWDNGLPATPFWFPLLAFFFAIFSAQRLKTSSARRAVAVLAFLPSLVRFTPPFAWVISRVAYRSVGDDPLAYQSFARDAWVNKSLRAGEDIFFFQPGGRYAYAILHLLFGERDYLISAVLFGATFVAVYFLAVRIVAMGNPARVGAALAALCVAWLLVDSQAANYESGLIEGMAWGLFLGSLSLMFMPRRRSDEWLGLVLLGLATFVRVNNAFGSAAVILVFLMVRRWPVKRWIPAFAVGSSGVGLCLLHNAWWGHKFQVLRVHDATIAVRRDRVLSALWNATARREVRKQLWDLIYLSPSEPLYPGYALAFAAAVALSVWFVARVGFGGPWEGWIERCWRCLPLLPVLGYLGLYLSFRANIYYPRHLVVGYLWIAAMSAVLIGTAALRGHRVRDAALPSNTLGYGGPDG